ncbi:ferredoxin [Myxosarcina sp. GI1]|uniref:(2Fe-2S) ferredoxin domain-containing protein n=1 Tax=Myxosarcina sp. GI1 TaxID=1541065 RepID=UPI0006913778|nr:(2Fe-2S) ferredoxin domain-containing protein [Myxosarcina sp. GI1]
MNKSPKRVVICLGRSCRKYNSQKVLAAFKQNQDLLAEIELDTVKCLGQCGNGPMVSIEPDGVWYSQVRPKEVPLVIEQHLIGQSPVREMLYPKFHSKK